MDDLIVVVRRDEAKTSGGGQGRNRIALHPVHPGCAELDRRAPLLDGVNASTDAIACLDHGDPDTTIGEGSGRSSARDSRTDDDGRTRLDLLKQEGRRTPA